MIEFCREKIRNPFYLVEQFLSGCVKRFVWVFWGRKNEMGAGRRVLMIKEREPRIEMQSMGGEGSLTATE